MVFSTRWPMALGLLILACDSATPGTRGPDAAAPGLDASSDPSTGTPDAAGDGDGPDLPLHDASVDAAQPVTSTGPGDWGPGDYPPDPHSGDYLELTDLPGQPGKVRGYKVHVPPSYDPSVPMPAVFAFHASNMTAIMFAVDGIGLLPKADTEGFIAVMPNGIQEDGFGGSWNGGTCCGAAADQQLDDVGFVRAVFAQLGEHLNIDLTRVYALGLSNGAHMAYRLGCEASDIFAAIAPLAGGVCTPELAPEPHDVMTSFTSCAPAYPVAVLGMHGTKDTFVPYESLKPTLDFWATTEGCTTTTRTADAPLSGGDTSCVTYTGCPSGIEVTGCSVMDGGHCWFGSDNCGTGAPLGIGNLVVGNNSNMLKATDEAWSFFTRHTRVR
jgi:polyhydroxybutyrate depolymerase